MIIVAYVLVDMGRLAYYGVLTFPYKLICKAIFIYESAYWFRKTLYIKFYKLGKALYNQKQYAFNEETKRALIEQRMASR